jgi:hypothetical protein
MLLTFIGAISVAVLGACLAFILNRTTGIQARWLIPASAGAGMLGFTIWADYSWFGRVAGELPPEVVVARTHATSWAVQPWTLAVPAVTRFQAVNAGGAVAIPASPDVVLAEVYLVARYQPTFAALMLFDCAHGRRADAVDADEDGLPPDGAWVAVGADDPVLRAACEGARG